MEDKALKEKWVDALQSGDYQQGKLCLHELGRYCCLGVLNHIRGCEQSYDGLDSVVGLDWIKLANMNDRGKSFPEIATWIQENL